MPKEMKKNMRIILNGEAREIAEQSTLLQLIGELGLDQTQIAAECDGGIVGPERFGSLRLREDMRVELIRFVGGGAC